MYNKNIKNIGVNMFKSLISSIKKQSISNTSNLLDFNNIEQLKEVQDNKSSPKDDQFDDLYNQAFVFIKQFYDNKDCNIDYLESASKCLVSAIEIRPSKAKPYLLLAYIYYIIQNTTLAVKYMKIAQQLDDKLPQIKQLQDLLNLGV